ncbi:hypothetical protein SPHI_11880 [Sphingomonas jeddahensis]|uniref:Uncharacterized protein n=1 Tax=Sphingomonas jeddahensis TaxID=1915074 RepID=A0A1V2EV25_9SPHN|nr:hypothetical protein SPHI_11880 [Sphingomonas jeddahensis]
MVGANVEAIVENARSSQLPQHSLQQPAPFPFVLSLSKDVFQAMRAVTRTSTGSVRTEKG